MTNPTNKMKQYLILDAKDIAQAPIMTLVRMKGTFIECPHCERLVRIVVMNNATEEDIRRTHD